METKKNKPKKIVTAEMNGKPQDINLYVCNEKTICPKSHGHAFYEIVLVTRGKALQYVNGQERVLAENDICILRPEAKHTVKSHADAPLTLYNFEVNEVYINELCRSLGFTCADDVLSNAESYTRLDAASTLEYMKLITIPQNLQDAQIKQIVLKIIVTKILINYLINPSHSLKSKKEFTLVETVLSMLEDIRNFKLSIKEICEKTFYTQEHITRLFQKAGLSSPNRIHLQKKMQYAANLLLNSDMKIIEIAELCGIETVAYFTKAFKKEYGAPPSVYQKKHRGNPNL